MEQQTIELKPWQAGFSLPARFNMVELLLERHLGGARGARTAIHSGKQQISYQRLGRLSNRAGNGLAALGLAPGDRVVLLLHDRPEFIACFLGAMKIGAVPVPCNVMATPSDWAYFISDSRAKVVVVEQELLPGLESIAHQCSDLAQVVVAGGAPQGRRSLAEITGSASERLDPFPTRAEDHSYWLYTSGTTGRPKGVIHLHQDLVYAVETWGKHVLDFQPDDVVYCVSRLFFSYGLNNALYLPLYYGASVVLDSRRPQPQTVVELLEKYRPTVLFSVPTSYGQVLNHLEQTGRRPDFASLRACISAGEALPAALFESWRDRFGLEILDGLGSSEVSFIYICNRPGRARPGSSGQVLPGYRVKLCDEAGAEVPRGQVGELWVKSPTITPGYWQRPGKTAEAFNNGWFKTGDRFRQDAEGYFYYFGRANDSLKVGGIWVSPLEIEEALQKHPAVAEAVVVGKPDAMGLVKPQAFVTLREGFTPGEDLTRELQAHVKGRLAPYKYPRFIEYLSELPKTATGKVQRFRLRQGRYDRD